MVYLSERLPHVVTRADLVAVLSTTYAAAQSVDEEEAADRLGRALANPALLDDLTWCLSEALATRVGPRVSADALMDKLSKGIGARRFKVKAAPSTPEISAVLVHIDLAIGIASESIRVVMESEKGRAAFDKGLRALGEHLVRELLK